MSKPTVNWGFSCGRYYLTVNGYVTAMEGDTIRDMELSQKAWELYEAKWKDDKHWESMKRVFGAVWSGELIKWLAAEANGGKLP